jgi:type I restriction enzyme S subunit
MLSVIEFLFRIPQFIMEVRRHSHGIVDDRLRLYWDGFKNIRIPLPPLSEQKLIADHLVDERTKTAASETALRDSIGLLKERRNALITAAVTEQIQNPEISPEKEVRYAN